MPATARKPPGALVTPALLELAQRMQKFGRGDLADRTVAKGGVGRLEQPAVFLQRRLRPLFPSLLVQKSSATSRKRVAAGGARNLFQPTLEARILGCGKQFPGGFAALARFGQRHLRIGPQRDLLLPALKAIGKAP